MFHYTDIKECELQLDDCNNSECVDTDGGYSCSCLPGFVALTNSSVCEGRYTIDWQTYPIFPRAKTTDNRFDRKPVI